MLTKWQGILGVDLYCFPFLSAEKLQALQRKIYKIVQRWGPLHSMHWRFVVVEVADGGSVWAGEGLVVSRFHNSKLI